MESYITLKWCVCDATISRVGMLPRPMTRVLGGFGEGAVLVHMRVDQRNIAIVGFGMLVHQSEHALSACQRHDDGIELLGYRIDIARKLLGHIQERHGNINGHD